MKVVLSPNPYRDRGLKAARAAERILKNVGVETVFCLPFSVDKSSVNLPKQVELRDLKTELPNAEMLVCFGGDGTILHTAKDASACGVPILGVNLGTMGFMAELEQGELPLLTRIASGKYSVESRVMMDVTLYHEEKVVYTDRAFNDAAVTKGAIARMVDLEIYSDQELITGFSADGVVISTPTGSTAYSMSAGGPLVEPTAENMIVTPICPHVLAARSFVLGRDRELTIRMKSGSRRGAYLSVDGGKALNLVSGDRVQMKLSEIKTKLVRVTQRSFYQILNQKLGGHSV